MNEFKPTPMTQIIEKGNKIEIEIESTIPIEQYGNIKPKLKTTCDKWEDVPSICNLMQKNIFTIYVQSKNKYQGVQI